MENDHNPWKSRRKGIADEFPLPSAHENAVRRYEREIRNWASTTVITTCPAASSYSYDEP
jgi:hypothetical protein